MLCACVTFATVKVRKGGHRRAGIEKRWMMKELLNLQCSWWGAVTRDELSERLGMYLFVDRK
jgi:hypothetical protein